MELVAQSDDSGAAVLGVLIALGIIGLQIYLIVAIIATRQDVKWMRAVMEGRGHSSAPPLTPASSPVYVTPGVAPDQAAFVDESATSVAYSIYLVAGGPNPESVANILVSRCGYARSGAVGAVKGSGQRIATTRDAAAARALTDAIEAAGGSVEVKQVGGVRAESRPQEDAVQSPPAGGSGWSGSQMASAAAPTKKCPDCAESVLAEAKVCRHCGLRFQPS